MNSVTINNEKIITLDKVNDLIEDLEFQYKKDDLLSRKEVEEQYHLTQKGVAKIFNMKNAPVVKLGKEQKISRSTLENIFKQGICL